MEPLSLDKVDSVTQALPADVSDLIRVYAYESLGEKMRHKQAQMQELTRIQRDISPDAYVQANVDALVEQLEATVEDGDYIHVTKAKGHIYWSNEYTVEQGQYVEAETLRLLQERCDGVKVEYGPSKVDEYGFSVPQPPDTTVRIVQTSSLFANDDERDDEDNWMTRCVHPGRRYTAAYTTRLVTRDKMKKRLAKGIVNDIMGPKTDAERAEAKAVTTNEYIKLPRVKLLDRVLTECIVMVYDANRRVFFDWSQPTS
jgi:hypothetical protein